MGFDPDKFLAAPAPKKSSGFDPDKFLGADAPPPSDLLSVVEEMHPDISSIDRLVVKNLSNSPEAGVRYIKKKLPGHDVRLYQGRMVVKGPQDKEYRVLDPDTGFFSKDMLRDAGDVLFDVGSGVAEGAATAAGAAAGGLPGAMAAGGASGAGLEAARQGLGKLAGIEQDMDGTDIAISGGVSAALPAIGAGLGKAYKAAKKSLFPALGEMVSGVPRGAIEHAGKNFPTLELLEKEGGAEDMIEEGVQKKVKSVLFGRQNEVGKGIEDTVAALKGKISTDEAREPFKVLLNEFKANADELGTDVAKQKVVDLEDAIKGILGEKEAISPAGAFNLQKDLAELADLPKLNKAGIGSRFSGSTSLTDRRVAEAARKSREAIGSQLDKLSGGELSNLNKAYSTVKEDLKYLTKAMKTPESTYSMLTSLRNKPLRLSRLKDIDSRYGTDLIKSAKDLDAAKYLGKPALSQLSGLGTTSTSRSIPLATVGGTLGSLIGYNSDMLPGSGYGRAAAGGAAGVALGGALGSPAMIKQIIKNGLRAQRAAAKIKPGTVPGALKSAWELGRDR